VSRGPLQRFSPVVGTLACGEERHSILWEAGELIPLHHADPSGERSLAALGGVSCPCIEVLGAWARRRGDARVLAALPRGVTDLIGSRDMPAAARAQMRAIARLRAAPSGRQVGGYISNVISGGGRAGTRRLASAQHVLTAGGGAGGLQLADEREILENDIQIVAGLGPPMASRLVATVTVTFLDRMAEDDRAGLDLLPALEASLYGRALTALRQWTGRLLLGLQLVVVPRGDEFLREIDGEDTMSAGLPLGWVAEVWGRDLATVGSYFTLDAAGSEDGTTTLRVTDLALGPTRTVSIADRAATGEIGVQGP
jgi:hypothetical protein